MTHAAAASPARLRHTRAALAALVAAAALGAFAALPATARADGGFQLGRYQSAVAGESGFTVDRPWYSSTRRFAIGLTFDYANNPLLLGDTSQSGVFSPRWFVVQHATLLHVDAAVSFLDRLTISASLPLVLGEWGAAPAANLADPGIKPSGFALGDPRVGLMARLWNHADANMFSIHLGASVWIPVGADGNHAGDGGVRVAPRLVMSGMFLDHLRWSLTGGYLYRGEAQLGTRPPLEAAGTSSGPELQLGAAVGFTDSERRLHVGPEAVLGTVLSGGHAFDSGYTGFEVLVGAQYLFWKSLQVGAAIGTGLGRVAGTPDVRGLVRIAWAPLGSSDLDRDGVPDLQDACPNTYGAASDDPVRNGCPDRDKDGVLDADDLCPDDPRGDAPDPDKAGCPAKQEPDKDGDGVPDDKDACVDVPKGAVPDAAKAGCPADKDGDGVIDEKDACADAPQGASPDPNRAGCPQNDADGDGVTDDKDKCPKVAAGGRPDPARAGCPLDSDRDGVIDEKDACDKVPAGLNPDPAKAGCPLPDQDRDNIVDASDACPDKAGAPDPDPKKNGCPGLVQISGCQIQINDQVYFATGKDVILPKSTPVLQSMANALKLSPQIKRVSIDGHTDNAGKLAANMDLSDRRAKAVLVWLTQTGGIAADRLESHGYGPTRPIADNKSAAGKAQNRRVEFNILDPVCAEAEKPAPAPAAPAPRSGSPRKGR